MRQVTKGARVSLVAVVAACACASHAPPPPVPLPPLEAPPEAVAAESSVYRLHVGDLLRVKYLYHPELDIRVPIRPDGDITLQVAGQIHAAGLTTSELEQVIKERTSDRLRNPEISVVVAQVADTKVYVGGEVRIPGFVAFHEGLTPLQAIMDRGGFTDTARQDSVLRLTPGRTDYQGTRLDFSKPLSEGTPEGTRLAAGDVLFVPRTFIGDVNTFVRLYIREVLPIPPRIGAGTTF